MRNKNVNLDDKKSQTSEKSDKLARKKSDKKSQVVKKKWQTSIKKK